MPGGGEEGEKKSVFAGFGGFSTTTSASDAFSFLAKSASTTSAEAKKPEMGKFVADTVFCMKNFKLLVRYLMFEQF